MHEQNAVGQLLLAMFVACVVDTQSELPTYSYFKISASNLEKRHSMHKRLVPQRNKSSPPMSFSKSLHLFLLSQRHVHTSSVNGRNTHGEVSLVWEIPDLWPDGASFHPKCQSVEHAEIGWGLNPKADELTHWLTDCQSVSQSSNAKWIKVSIDTTNQQTLMLMYIQILSLLNSMCPITWNVFHYGLVVLHKL